MFDSEKSIKSTKSQKNCAPEKKSKTFSKVIRFEALPNIFKVTYRRSSEQQRVYIYTLFYSFWTYAIFCFFWSISRTTSWYLQNLLICCCSKYVQIKRCFNFYFENDWFPLGKRHFDVLFIYTMAAHLPRHTLRPVLLLCVYIHFSEIAIVFVDGGSRWRRVSV